MNVRELREAIKDLPDEWPVILQKDAEGNGYSPLDDARSRLYQAESTWSGEVYEIGMKLSDQKPGVDWDEDDYEYFTPETAVPCLVLGPVN